MAKSDIKYYEGTNQIEFLHMKEGDVRRHKSNCVYYNKATKRCGKICITCVGSSHCSFYKIREDVRQEKKTKNRQNKIITTSQEKHYVDDKSESQVHEIRLRTYLERIKETCIVIHKVKGRGVVVSVNGHVIKVKFLNDGGKVTCLDAAFCMDKDLLR